MSKHFAIKKCYDKNIDLDLYKTIHKIPTWRQTDKESNNYKDMQTLWQRKTNTKRHTNRANGHRWGMGIGKKVPRILHKQFITKSNTVREVIFKSKLLNPKCCNGKT